MAKKLLKIFMALFILTLISGVIFFYLSGRSEHSSQENTHYRFSKKKNDLTIRGFHFSGYHEGLKTIAIKAARFSTEKKKIGIFKLSPLRAARFRGAEIDFYLNSDSSDGSLQDKRIITTRGLFSKETLPVSLLKGSTSVVFEPVKISFCLDDMPVTEIQYPVEKI